MQAQRTVRIRNKMGMHVRPATTLAELARGFRSAVAIVKDGQKVDAKSSIELLTLAATEGTELMIVAEGEDAQAAVQRLFELIDSGFEIK